MNRRAAMRLMIVDDNPIMRGMIRTVTVLPGDIVKECASGEEALRELVSFGPDMVLMDLQMTGIDGIQATREIKRMRPQTRVVVVSNFTDEQSKRAALQAGADDFLPKDQLLEIPRSFPSDPSSGKETLRS